MRVISELNSKGGGKKVRVRSIGWRAKAINILNARSSGDVSVITTMPVKLIHPLYTM